MRIVPFLVAGMLAMALAACDGKPPVAAAPAGGDFVLQSAAGPVDSKALRGQVLLVYFGYTHCPDICPTSMAAGAQALNQLTPQERAKTKLIMVSVDPERDSPARLKEYVAYFHPDMLGVTGTPAEVAAVAKAYGAGYQRAAPDAGGAYTVDHSAFTYLVDGQGRLAAVLPMGMPVADIVAAIRQHLP
jgi:protein SCO1/2